MDIEPYEFLRTVAEKIEQEDQEEIIPFLLSRCAYIKKHFYTKRLDVEMETLLEAI